MNWKGLVWCIVCAAFTEHAFAQSIDAITVGLVDFEEASSVRCQVAEGSYCWGVVKDGSWTEWEPLEGTHEIKKTDQSWTWTGNAASHSAAYFILKPSDEQSKIRLISPVTGYRQYRGAVHFYWHENRWHVALETDIESYLPGVLASEIGKGHATALYEAHAMVSRTYAIHTYGRHRLAGYDVCDQVHCQVFAGVSTVNDTLQAACAATRNMVLVDRLGRPIVAAFHSNCGGQTRSAAEVWQSSMPYLAPVTDTLCHTGAHATWTRSVEPQQWDAWVASNDSMATFDLAARRQFGLPSARFTVQRANDSIHLHGKGFGHGVGFCQEGAMQRSLKGASTWSLLEAYYTGIRLRSLDHITIPEANDASGK